MKGRAILATVALALSVLVACGGEAPTSPPAKGATGQRVKAAMVEFLERY